MSENTFRKIAVSHYLVFDSVCDDKPPRVFLELPIKSHEYWMEVDTEAAKDFFSRFYPIAKGLPMQL